jgi:aminoglycoside phosphotransferase (APT) family kinase protein
MTHRSFHNTLMGDGALADGQASPPGLDLPRLAAYLEAALPEPPAGPLTGELIAGGKSNLTYRVTDGRSVWAVRRPPLGHVLPTAHDMTREFRVLSALAGTPVPVPRVSLLCAEEEVLGAPFYLMEYVDGTVLRDPAQTAALPAATVAGLAARLVEVLAALHAVDPAAVGLGDFGRPEGFLRRQVARWHTQWERSKTRELPALEELATGLADSVPDSGLVGIVHGDYRLDNVMFDHGLHRIIAVLDWEMATLGDPLADVGLLWVYTALAGVGLGPANPFPTSSGFPTPAEMAAAYVRLRPVPLDRLHWYAALGYYKLAIVSEGIHKRFLAGQTVGAGFEQMGPRVPELVDRAHRALIDGDGW